uniref:NADH-ubiquinone oxidoreductase chain 3 n=1 Tax=Coleoptera sp. ACP-2013 TaxID=2485033 RepID=A0A3G3MEU3_9COLE|nr:NADH dehydrogenase subunit 3 [Coleoptera sp. ACP-2013]
MIKILINLLLLINMIMFMLTMLLNLISKKKIYNFEKSTPFECGFEPLTSSRLPFSLHFFLIAIIFLIFDIEITLLLPLIKIINYSNIMNYMFIITIFIIILLWGLIHEWNQGALNWLN